MKKQNSLYRMTTSEMQIMTYLEFQGACYRQPDRFRFDPDPELHLEAAFCLYHPEESFRERPDPRCWVRENRQDLLPQICSQSEPRRIPAMQVMNELPDQELPEFLEFFQGKVG